MAVPAYFVKDLNLDQYEIRSTVTTWTYIYSRYINPNSCMSYHGQRGDESLPVAFYHINQVIRGAIWFPYGDVRIAELVLAEHGLDFVVINARERHGVCDRDSALVFLANHDRRRFLVESYAKSFQFIFNDLLVPKRFENV